MRWLSPVFLLLSGAAGAGGGLVLSNDTCIMTIGFYEAHFTAYQSQTSGDEEFCENLPASGATLVVLDYLHRSMSEVPIDFRIIRNETGKGEFARLPDVEALPDIDAATVFYQPPKVQPNGTLLVEFTIEEDGEYIGIVTAGHPTNDKTYVSVFPFTAGRTRLPWGWLALVAAVLFGAALLLRMKHLGERPAASTA